MSKLLPLPVTVEPEADESGLGALLRSARGNGLGLRYMLGWMGIGGLRCQSRERVSFLADVVGVPHAWLQRNLCVERKGDGLRWTEWLGHRWVSQLSLRGLRVQYCPCCLRERPICRSAWEVTGAFACERHRVLLCERCPHCKSPVRWDRPAPEICRCGHYLSGAGGIEATELQLLWVATILAAAGIDESSRAIDRGSLPRWFSMLSADGLFSIVHAAGVRKGNGSPLPSKMSMYVAAPADVAVVVGRGISRLLEVGELQHPCTAEMRGVLHEEALERILKRSNVLADRDVTSELLAWMRDRPKQGASLSGRKVRGQLRLFT